MHLNGVAYGWAPMAGLGIALFIIPRSVGFIAHFLEQKRNDEGLFRLPDDLLLVRKPGKRA